MNRRKERLKEGEGKQRKIGRQIIAKEKLAHFVA